MTNRNKIILSSLAAAGAAVFSYYYYPYYLNYIEPAVAGATLDHSVKTVPGEFIKVGQAIDGDTVQLVNGDRLRYVGIDTPEEFDQRKPVQCFAVEAAAKNRELVENKNIKFFKDVSVRDKYGRWLGFVYLPDGTFVNLELVRLGYAFAYPYPPDVSRAGEFLAAEEYARTKRLGLWGGACEVSKLSTGREQTNPVK